MHRGLLAALAVVAIGLTYAPEASALKMVEFNCANIPEACQNMCWGAYCKGSGTALTYDRPNKQTKAARRKAAGCAPNPNRCSTKKGHASGYQCDEYIFASTKKQNGAATRVNRCIQSGQNSKQGATLSKFYRKQCPGTGNCDFIVVFGNPGTKGAEYCEAGSAGKNSCNNDGQEQVGPNKRRRDGYMAPAVNSALYRLASGTEISGPLDLALNSTVSRIVPINETLYEQQIASHVLPDYDNADGTDGDDDVDEFEYMLDNLEVVEDPIVEIL